MIVLRIKGITTMKKDQRYLDSLASKFTEKAHANTLFILSPSDVGVVKNRGRNGTRFAPQVIINNFKKMNDHLENISGIHSLSNTSNELERDGLEKSHEEKYKRIQNSMEKNYRNIVHIGGGHDHAYPLLTAVEKSKKFKKLIIINIDAHCDTRVDQNLHSGTPFRNFDKETKLDVHMIQYGIHKYANSPKTLSNLENINQLIIYQDSLDKEIELEDVDKDTFIYLSLDADGLDNSIMSAVSAVNPAGVQLKEVELIISKIKTKIKETECKACFGIYEYNPIYDDLSNKGAKVISHLIYNWLS